MMTALPAKISKQNGHRNQIFHIQFSKNKQFRPALDSSDSQHQAVTAEDADNQSGTPNPNPLAASGAVLPEIADCPAPRALVPRIHFLVSLHFFTSSRLPTHNPEKLFFRTLCRKPAKNLIFKELIQYPFSVHKSIYGLKKKEV